MGRGTSLTESEKTLILHLETQKKSITEIADAVSRSRKVIYNFVANPEAYGKKKSPGRPKCITHRQERLIIRMASNSARTARQIGEAVGVSVSVRTVRKVIQKAPHLKRKKLKRSPPLTQARPQKPSVRLRSKACTVGRKLACSSVL